MRPIDIYGSRVLGQKEMNVFYLSHRRNMQVIFWPRFEYSNNLFKSIS